jgi:hypothetical protein
LPAESNQASLYRLVLDHGNFGNHNMYVAEYSDGQPDVTSLFGWSFGCIVPAILSDPQMKALIDPFTWSHVNMTTDENASPSFTKTILVNEVRMDIPIPKYTEHELWAKQYYKVGPSFT